MKARFILMTTRGEATGIPILQMRKRGQRGYVACSCLLPTDCPPPLPCASSHPGILHCAQPQGLDFCPEPAPCHLTALQFPLAALCLPSCQSLLGVAACRSRARHHSLGLPGVIRPSRRASLLFHRDLSPTSLTFSTADNPLQCGLITSYRQARTGSFLFRNLQIKVLGTLLAVSMPGDPWEGGE